VVYALAVIAAAISTVALLVMVSVTAFLVSLAFRARRTPDSRRSTTDLQTSIADHFRANRPRTLHVEALPQVRIARITHQISSLR